MALKPQPNQILTTRLHQLLAGPRRLDWQLCEPRLVLSAQLLSDIIDPLQLQQHGALVNGSHLNGGLFQGIQSDSHPVIGNEIGSAPGLEPQASAAHQQTGWTTLQQEFGLKGSGQTVAVIDSGVAWDHVALGKGFGAGYRVVGGWDFAENDSNPYDDGPTGFHGTHVTGIIGSDSPQNPGVAPGVDLVGLRVFNDQGQGQIEWVEQALAWVHMHRDSFANPITTVNLSLGTTWNSDTVPGWATLENELKQLYDDGIIVTASAGNSFKQYNAPGLSYPAASTYVLPVASVDDNGSLSDFSQRSDRVIAAPGRNILSTVPDHVLGRDGKINDFSTASGTSMAAPYMAGASVLVREAMEMVGIQDITPARIIDWLHDTADTVYDSITKANYDRLDLQNAIDGLIPDDNVGDTASAASQIPLSQRSVSGWINHLGDQDVFRFTAQADGRLSLDADSDWVESLKWSIFSNGKSLISDATDQHSLALAAGQSYELRLSAGQEIGPFQLDLDFQAATSPSPPTPPPTPNPSSFTDIGTVDYSLRQVAGGTAWRATATHDGIFTVQWDNPDSASGSLSVRDANGSWQSDSTWSDGKLRLDLNARAGQVFEIQLPGLQADQGILAIADIVQQQGSTLSVRDAVGNDNINLDLSHGISLKVGQLEYEFATSQINRIAIDGSSGSDQLSVLSSQLADKVELRPGLFALENTQLQVSATGIETVKFDSGSGAEDRLGMYDSDGDDSLVVRADSAELTGLGYKFTLSNVDRYVINSTGQGEDVATLYDSAGNDTLSVRPQFTSLYSDNYFASVRGFERVWVYASQGGYDTADIYDSAGDDRFVTSGEAAAIIGPGFQSYTKFFEQVNAHAVAGGRDVAELYGSSHQTQWQRGSDFVSFSEAQWQRNAQGFERTDAFVNGLMQSIPDASSLHSQSIDTYCVDSYQPANDSLASAASEITPQAFAQQVVAEHSNAQAPTVHDDDPAQLLLEVMELQSTAQLATSNLRFATDAPAERQLLDEIFSELG